MTIVEYLQKQGYAVSDAYQTHIDNWADWYAGKTKFHKYTVYNGIQRVKRTRKTLGMAKKLSEDWANLLLNEKVAITVPDAKFDEALKDTLKLNRFRKRGNQLIEMAFALGTGAFVEYLDAQGRAVIDYVRASCIYPLAWDNGEITECAFASERNVKGRLCCYVNMHVLDGGTTYIVKNRMIDKEDGHEIELPAGLEADIPTGSSLPRFQIITPNICNNIDMDCPMGVSVFANAIDNLENVDMVWDSYDNEFRLGKKRIIVPASMAKIEMAHAGEAAPIFDANDTEFYALNMGGDPDKNKLTEINMTLRADAHEKALQTALSLLSDKCGLGTDRYSYQRAAGVRTATEIVSERSALYQALKKHELILEDALIDMTRAIAQMLGYDPNMDISVTFDDSIIQDTDALRQQAMLEFNSGLIDEVEYHMRVYGLTEEAAIKKVAEMKARKPKPEEADADPFSDGEDSEAAESAKKPGDGGDSE